MTSEPRVLGGQRLAGPVGRADRAPAAAEVLLGLVCASIQAVFRSLYPSLLPAEKAAELFGFNAIASRLSAALGPPIFGAVAAAFGSPAWALGLLLLPLAAGAAPLLTAALPGRGEATWLPART